MRGEKKMFNVNRKQNSIYLHRQIDTKQIVGFTLNAAKKKNILIYITKSEI